MNIFYKKRNGHGFTLVELLVVVSIIGILLAIVTIFFNEARKRARDAERYADLSKIQVALELYRSVHDEYPSTNGSWHTVCTNGADPTARDTFGTNGYIPNLAPEFLPQLPTDPKGCTAGGVKGYIYRSNGVDYKIAVDWSADIGKECQLGERFDDRRTTVANYKFCSLNSPGAENW